MGPGERVRADVLVHAGLQLRGQEWAIQSRKLSHCPSAALRVQSDSTSTQSRPTIALRDGALLASGMMNRAVGDAVAHVNTSDETGLALACTKDEGVCSCTGAAVQACKSKTTTPLSSHCSFHRPVAARHASPNASGNGQAACERSEPCGHSERHASRTGSSHSSTSTHAPGPPQWPIETGMLLPSEATHCNCRLRCPGPQPCRFFASQLLYGPG